MWKGVPFSDSPWEEAVWVDGQGWMKDVSSRWISSPMLAWCVPSDALNLLTHQMRWDWDHPAVTRLRSPRRDHFHWFPSVSDSDNSISPKLNMPAGSFCRGRAAWVRPMVLWTGLYPIWQLLYIHTLRVRCAHAAANLIWRYSKYLDVVRMHYFCTIALRTHYAHVRQWA